MVPVGFWQKGRAGGFFLGALLLLVMVLVPGAGTGSERRAPGG